MRTAITKATAMDVKTVVRTPTQLGTDIRGSLDYTVLHSSQISSRDMKMATNRVGLKLSTIAAIRNIKGHSHLSPKLIIVARSNTSENPEIAANIMTKRSGFVSIIC